MDSLSVKIKSLGYSTIEREICDYYNLGYANSSTLPITMQEDESGTFYIDATHGSGDFSIRITKQPDEMYHLFACGRNIKRK